MTRPMRAAGQSGHSATTRLPLNKNSIYTMCVFFHNSCYGRCPVPPPLRSPIPFPLIFPNSPQLSPILRPLIEWSKNEKMEVICLFPLLVIPSGRAGAAGFPLAGAVRAMPYTRAFREGRARIGAYGSIFWAHRPFGIHSTTLKIDHPKHHRKHSTPLSNAI